MPAVRWVTHEPPNRSGGGGNIRQAYLLRAVAEAFPTDLVVVGALEDDELRGALRSVTELPESRDRAPRDPIGRRIYTLGLTLAWPEPAQAFPGLGPRRRLAKALKDARADVDIVMVEQEALGPLLPARRSVPWVITFEHVLSTMAAQEEAKAPGRRQRWMWSVEHRKARKFETRIVREWDAVVTCSEPDAEYLRALAAPHVPPMTMVPNGVNLDRFPVTPLPAAPSLLLPGTLCFAPNIDGAVWFCDEVLPRVQAEVPDVTLTIAGRDPWPQVLRLAERPGVTVMGDVPSLIPYFVDSRVVIVPLRVGTGTRLKALEGMAAARPVVGTAIGLEGLAVEDRVSVRIADDPARHGRGRRRAVAGRRGGRGASGGRPGVGGGPLRLGADRRRAGGLDARADGGPARSTTPVIAAPAAAGGVLGDRHQLRLVATPASLPATPDGSPIT